MVRPEATNVHASAFAGVALILIVTERPSASFIWEEMVRIQTSSYNRNWSPVSRVWAGVRKVSPAGRIASCAS
jgi:hypothetical protein